MVRAYLMSFVARQALLLKDQLASRYPNAWLVWEPGAWSVPATEGAGAETRLPTSSSAVTAPLKGDALCFELALPAQASALKLGRAEGNDIVVNDATVSREQLVFTREGGRWMAQAPTVARPALLGAAPLAPGAKTALADGAQLKVGDVCFTFQESASFLKRVASAATLLA